MCASDVTFLLHQRLTCANQCGTLRTMSTRSRAALISASVPRHLLATGRRIIFRHENKTIGIVDEIAKPIKFFETSPDLEALRQLLSMRDQLAFDPEHCVVFHFIRPDENYDYMVQARNARHKLGKRYHGESIKDPT